MMPSPGESLVLLFPRLCRSRHQRHSKSVTKVLYGPEALKEVSGALSKDLMRATIKGEARPVV